MRRIKALILSAVLLVMAAVSPALAAGNPCVYYNGIYQTSGYSDILNITDRDGITFIVDVKVTDATVGKITEDSIGTPARQNRDGTEKEWSRFNVLTSTRPTGTAFSYLMYNFGKSRFEISYACNWNYKDYEIGSDYNLFASKEVDWTLNEWHEFAYKSNGSHFEIWFDGEKVLETDLIGETDLQKFIIITCSYLNAYFDNMIVADKDFDIVNKTGEIYYFDHDFNPETALWHLQSDKYSISPDGTDKVVYVEDGYVHDHVYKTCEKVEPMPGAEGYTKSVCLVCGDIQKFDIVDPLPSIKGDVNGDTKVDTTDVIVTRKHLAGWSGLTVDTNAADVDGNGKVDTSDVILLMKYLAGWNVDING